MPPDRPGSLAHDAKPDDNSVDAPLTLEDRIDESIEESFPASDPPAVHAPERK